MKKALCVFGFAMLLSAPVIAEAQWFAPFVYPEPQIAYPYPAPPVIYPASPPVVMYPAPPPVIYAPPPPVMIQLPPAPTVSQPPRHHVLKSGGATIVTKCTNCTVTNTINDGQAAVKQLPKPASPSSSSASQLAVWLVAAAIIILVLLTMVINQRMTRPRAESPSPNPVREAALAPQADTNAARRPRPRVHRRKCEHPDCHHKIEICCHAERDGDSHEATER